MSSGIFRTTVHAVVAELPEIAWTMLRRYREGEALATIAASYGLTPDAARELIVSALRRSKGIIEDKPARSGFSATGGQGGASMKEAQGAYQQDGQSSSSAGMPSCKS